jgi:hypothetical protein
MRDNYALFNTVIEPRVKQLEVLGKQLASTDLYTTMATPARRMSQRLFVWFMGRRQRQEAITALTAL